ncbi:hypothetical protein [Lysinibacillus sp. NPDC047702]|uniref:hypothetical protein n=1 Tax=unclassified Lysinibacillus TaxID=2636778 RepID=UPI003D014251
MKKTYRKWSISVVILCLVLIISIVTLNYVVNPYNIFNSPTFKGFNEQKIDSKVYLLKTKDIANKRPDTIFLGSSRTHQGLDPKFYNKIVGDEAYNLGLSSATINVQLKYLEYALKNNPSLKRVIIGLDFEAFNQFGTNPSSFTEKRLLTKYWNMDDLISNLFTKQAIIDSMHVIQENMKQISILTQDSILADGSHNEQVLLNNHQKLLNEGHNRFYEHLQEYLVNEQLLAKYKLSNKNLDYFKQLVDLCKENEIELIVFIQPSHALQWTGIERVGLWNQLEQWKKEIVQIVPVWDFSGYNSITTTSTENFNTYSDQSHYRKKIGNLIMHRILQIESKKVPSDFGVYITEKNIQSHLNNITADRDVWIANNPDITQMIDQFIKK